jgi:CTP:molybdopterin cytidylyltransferase MocA
MTPPLPAILILAAGSSSRMAPRDKLLEPVAGQPLLARVADAARATGAPVVAVLPPDRPARAAALAGRGVRLVTAAQAREGLAASLKAGLAAVAEGPVLLLLADLPEIGTADLNRVLAARADHPDAILRGAAEDGTPGHPVLFPARFRGALMRLTGDQGARELLRDHAAEVRLVPLPGRHAIADLDTPEDWARWRAANPWAGTGA